MTDDDSPLIFPFVSFLLCSLACLPFSLPGPNRSSMNATRHQIRTSTSMRQFSRSTFQHTSKLLIQVRKTIAIFLFGPFFAVKEAPISSHLISSHSRIAADDKWKGTDSSHDQSQSLSFYVVEHAKEEPARYLESAVLEPGAEMSRRVYVSSRGVCSMACCYLDMWLLSAFSFLAVLRRSVAVNLCLSLVGSRRYVQTLRR